MIGAVLLVLLTAACVSDLRTRRIPNLLVVATAVTGTAIAVLTKPVIPGLMQAGGGLGTGLVIWLPFYALGMLGAGDVKLFAAAGALLGPATTVRAFFFTAIAGGVLALIVARRRRLLRATVERTATLVKTAAANVTEIEGTTINNRFAYAPAIAVGALAAVLGL